MSLFVDPYEPVTANRPLLTMVVKISSPDNTICESILNTLPLTVPSGVTANNWLLADTISNTLPLISTLAVMLPVDIKDGSCKSLSCCEEEMIPSGISTISSHFDAVINPRSLI